MLAVPGDSAAVRAKATSDGLLPAEGNPARWSMDVDFAGIPP